MNPAPLLIRMPNWLGDVVMSVSAIDAIHRAGRHSIHLLIREPWDALFRNDPRISETIVCRDRAATIFSTAAVLRARHFETVVDFTHSVRSRILWSLARIPRVIRESLPARKDGTPVHQSVRYLNIARALAPADHPVPAPPSLAHPHSGEVSEGQILLFPGAAYGPAKTWSPARYADLIDLLALRGMQVKIMGSASERPMSDDILRELSLRGSNPANIETAIGLDVPALMRAVSSAQAVISGDSGAAHLAAALGKPVVVLFFSTDPRRTLPLGFAVRPVVAQVPCRPCFLRSCPIGYLCRDAVRPADVVAHMADLLDVP